jgi:hypothetical protein
MTGIRPGLIASALALCVQPAVAQAELLELAPRTALEAVVLGDATAAKAHLEALAERGKTDRAAVVEELLAAGFEPDRGTPKCDFYGYHRKTTTVGAARSAQVAMCSTGKNMVLVLDMLAPGTGGTGSGEMRKGYHP